MKQLPCACTECNCNNMIDVPKYVPDGTLIICVECLTEHAIVESPESTGM